MDRRSLRDDTRGLAVGLVAFFAALVIAALLFIPMDTAFSEVVTIATEQADHTGASDQITLMQGIWDAILFVALFVGALFVLGRAVREGEVR